MARFLTAEQMLKHLEEQYFIGMYKYVRVDGEFRFLEVDFDVNHSDAVEKHERPLVESAGTIKIRKNCFDYHEYGSWSLNVKWNEADTLLLTTLLERPLVRL